MYKPAEPRQLAVSPVLVLCALILARALLVSEGILSCNRESHLSALLRVSSGGSRSWLNVQPSLQGGKSGEGTYPADEPRLCARARRRFS